MAVGCVGIVYHRRQLPSLGTDINERSCGAGYKELTIFVFYFSISHPHPLIQLVMSASSPSTGIVIYNITDEGSLNYMNHNLSLVVIK